MAPQAPIERRQDLRILLRLPRVLLRHRGAEGEQSIRCRGGVLRRVSRRRQRSVPDGCAHGFADDWRAHERARGRADEGGPRTLRTGATRVGIGKISVLVPPRRRCRRKRGRPSVQERCRLPRRVLPRRSVLRELFVRHRGRMLPRVPDGVRRRRWQGGRSGRQVVSRHGFGEGQRSVGLRLRRYLPGTLCHGRFGGDAPVRFRGGLLRGVSVWQCPGRLLVPGH
mmetsp:Transcript_9540/g.21521  ORF Transcript_9540/g.21521 Transcript_9540/m.21521 type:complete len:225 (+) Transcript_9540:1099-1773(+)